MRTELALSHVRVEAGATAEVTIDVTNTTDIIDGVTAIVDGINPEWVRLDRPVVSLFPEASDHVVLFFDIPRTCQAGDYLIDVRIVSAVDPTQESVQDFWLTVEPYVDVVVDIRPSIIRGGRKGAAVATLRNTGNCAVEAIVTAEDPAREVDCTVTPPTVTLAYADEVPFDLEVRGRRPWFGESAARQVVVRVRSGDTEVEETLAFEQRPWISRGVVTVLTLAAIIALWAVIFLFLISWLRGADGAPKAVPNEIATGRENIELALIRGTVSGTVKASSTKEGIPKVTVEAFRIKRYPKVPGEPDPDPATTIESVASGGTDEDGRYQLRTLIPGSYVLRFSAPGYEPVWHPGQLGAGDPLDIAPLRPERDQDVELTGRTGSVELQIDLPDGTDINDLTVSISSKNATAESDASLSGASGFAQAGVDPSCTIQPIGPNGLVRCVDVPTPGDYVISIVGPGFETLRVDVSLVGGDDTVVDTVPLLGEPGTIQGVVVDQAGVALVGARVSVSSGQFEARVFSDRGGRFVVDDLPTPRDYVIDISIAGYTGRTIALELEAGDPLDIGDQRLVGGAGSMSGVVVDELRNGLGGVSIAVDGERSTAITASLTDGNRGAFFIQDLVVPGAYSVAFSAPGFQTETRIIDFDEAGSISLGEITMFTAFGSIGGSVVDPAGQAVGGAEVELIDGLRSRQTTTSTSGDGSFGFDDVSPGSYTVVVRSTDDPENVKMWVAQRDIAPGADLRLDGIVLPLSSLGQISGVVANSDGDGLGQVLVTLTGEGRTMTETTSSGAGGVGSYSFEELDVPGSYAVTYSLANYAPVTQTIVLTFNSGGFIVANNVELEAEPGPVSGTVVFAGTTDPVIGATVRISDMGVELATEVVTDNDGAFRFPSVRPGAVIVEVTYSEIDGSSGTASRSDTVLAGGLAIATPIEFSLQPPPTTTTISSTPPPPTVPPTVPPTSAPGP